MYYRKFNSYNHELAYLSKLNQVMSKKKYYLIYLKIIEKLNKDISHINNFESSLNISKLGDKWALQIVLLVAK